MNRHRKQLVISEDYYASHKEAMKSSQKNYRQRTSRIHKPDSTTRIPTAIPLQDDSRDGTSR